MCSLVIKWILWCKLLWTQFRQDHFSGEIGIKGGHMLECPYTSTVFRQRLTRQWLTHFLKIPKIFKIQKFFGELCQNPQFLVKIIFGVTLILLQSKICTPKIDTPKIDAFFKFWALLKCVNLWRRTVHQSISCMNDHFTS